jgi:hypothetical protein
MHMNNGFAQGFGANCGTGCISGSACGVRAEPLSPQLSAGGLCCPYGRHCLGMQQDLVVDGSPPLQQLHLRQRMIYS